MVSAALLRDVLQSGTEWDTAERAKAKLRAIRHSRDPLFLTLGELDDVFRYKLRRQYGRTRLRRAGLTDELVRLLTQAAFQVESPDRWQRLRIRVRVLCGLPGVGVPVASAILSLVEPEEYGVIDERAWKHLFDTGKSSFTQKDYERYMTQVWQLSDELGWLPQRVEWCIWRLYAE